MKTRATMTIYGDVQEVGFRAYAMRLGQKMRVSGYVENLFDGTVKVVCEGEKPVIENFAKKLKIKDDVTNVEKVEIVYSKPKNDFKGFRVKITDQGSEMFQGFATAGRLLTELRGDVRKGNAELGNTIVKGNAELGNKLGGKIDALGDRIDANFDKMDQKYGVISERMVTIMEELKQARVESAKATENLTKVVQTFVDMQKKQ